MASTLRAVLSSRYQDFATNAHTSANKDSLVLQGADLLVAWSALIDKKTGALTVSVADSEGAYVVFGQCKVAVTK